MEKANNQPDKPVKAEEKIKKLDGKTKRNLLIGRSVLGFFATYFVFSDLPSILIRQNGRHAELSGLFETLRICGLVMFALSAAAYVFLRIKDKKSDLKRLAAKVEMTHEFAKNNIEKFARKMKISAFLTRFYTAFTALFFLAVSIAFCAENSLVFGAVFFAVPYCCAVAFFKRDKLDFSRALDGKAARAVYEIAENAEKKSGLDKPLKIFAVSGNNIGITAYKEFLVLSIGINILQMLNRGELFNALLHEFAHVKNRDVYRTKKYAGIADYLSAATSEIAFGFICRLVFAWAAEAYGTTFNFYDFCSRLDGELKADAVERELGNKEDAVAVTVKMDYYDLWSKRFASENFYKNPEPPRGYYTDLYRRFLEDFKRNGEFWKGISESTLPFRLPTHPSVNERKEFFGVFEPVIKFPPIESYETDGKEDVNCGNTISNDEREDENCGNIISNGKQKDVNCGNTISNEKQQDGNCRKILSDEEQKEKDYQKTVAAIVSKMNSEVYDALKDTYDADRKYNYGQYETLKNEFEALTEEQKAALDSMAYAKYAMAYHNLAESDKGEKLFDLAIAADDRNALALYQKGALLISRYDPAGAEFVKSAIEKNHNYIEDGLDILGEFFTRTGRKEEKEALRAWMFEQIQRLVDWQTTHLFKKSDKITEQEIPGMTAAALTKAAKTHRAIVEIQAFKKTTKDGKPTHFVALLLDGERFDEWEEAYDEVFYILDNIEDGGPDYFLSVLNRDTVFAKNTKKLKNHILYKRTASAEADEAA
ncbi:MAG: M56 family metallopeptidase [Clostridiales bacterium]|jgi:Zn-dependent protease with chaperone function|nr:M56 family metallopeptidase [Clostridiales bacterium]